MNKMFRRLGLWIGVPFLTVFAAQRNSAAAIEQAAADIDGLSKQEPVAPLYLRHARDVFEGNKTLKLAGHRSHRSHSSHRSHYSSYNAPSAPTRPAPPVVVPKVEERKESPESVRLPSVKQPSPNEVAAGEFMRLGVAASREGKYDEAIGLYKKALEKTPRNAVAYNNLGAAYYRKADLAEARKAFSKSIEIDPSYGDAHYNTAVLLREQGDEQAALPEFKKACELGVSDACKIVGE